MSYSDNWQDHLAGAICVSSLCIGGAAPRAALNEKNPLGHRLFLIPCVTMLTSLAVLIKRKGDISSRLLGLSTFLLSGTSAIFLYHAGFNTH
jgi:hypothetical protein